MTEAPPPESGAGTADKLDGITAEHYRDSLRHYPAGVTVVTLNSGDGPVGFTATSFASLSLRPPLISFNIAHTSSSLAAMLGANSLVVHFLGAHQHTLARRFSRTAVERFTDPTLWTTLDTGEPILHDTPLWLRATVHQLIPIGDHTLVVGLVTRVHDTTPDSPTTPLLYYRGEYYRPVPLTGNPDHP